MSTITYGLAPSERVTKPVVAAQSPSKGWFARFIGHIVAARQRQAMEDLHRRGILLPHELEAAGWKITERSEDSLPFQR